MAEIDPATGFYPAPYSLIPIPEDIHKRLLIVGSVAVLSLLAAGTVVLLILYRFVNFNGRYKQSANHNQCVILVFNLLLADFVQAISFSLEFHWYRLDGIYAPSSVCRTQGALLNFGNLASGSFALAIAVHTVITIMRGKMVSHSWFVIAILMLWILPAAISFIGPAHWGWDFYTRAGNWCWISPQYAAERLWLHYLWVFIFQFASIMIYASLFFYIRSRTIDKSSPTSAKLVKAGRYMVVYPVVYIICTLPIAIGRMRSIAGYEPSPDYFIFAGIFLTSSGITDALVYATTRNILYNTGSGPSGSFQGCQDRSETSDAALELALSGGKLETTAIHANRRSVHFNTGVFDATLDAARFERMATIERIRNSVLSNESDLDSPGMPKLAMWVDLPTSGLSPTWPPSAMEEGVTSTTRLFPSRKTSFPWEASGSSIEAARDEPFDL